MQLDSPPKPPLRLPASFYYGWLVIGLSFVTTLTGAGIRSIPTVLIHPFELEFGWSRPAISFAISINLILFGVAGPIGGWFLDRFGPRLVMIGALSILVMGVSATTIMSQLWQLVLLWGVVVGLGAGAVGSVLLFFCGCAMTLLAWASNPTVQKAAAPSAPKDTPLDRAWGKSLHRPFPKFSAH